MAHYLKEMYQKEVVPNLMKDFGLDNPMQVPRLKKIVVNVGVGEALDETKALDATVEDMRTITGQAPVITLARKSIANFKLREGRAIGVKVTLRGEKMWAFLCPGRGTSAAFRWMPSTAEATTRSAFVSN